MRVVGFGSDPSIRFIKQINIPNHSSVADGLGLAVLEGGHQALLASGL